MIIVRSIRYLLHVSLLIAALLGAGGCGEDGSPSGSSDNGAPVIDTVVVSPDLVFQNDTTSVSVTASDPDDDSLTYRYVPNGGSIIGSGSTVLWIAPEEVGGYTVLATVNDGRGGLASRSATLNVVSRPAGITGTVSLTNPPGELAGARLALYTTMESWESDNPYYELLIPEDAATSYSFTILYLPAGTYYLDVWNDLNGNEEKDSADLYGFYGTGSLPAPDLSPIVVHANRATHLSSTIQVS